MRIVVINLERALERRQRMQAQLASLALDHAFFAAVDAARGQLDGVSRYDERRALRMLGHALTPAEVGCFASHYLLWERCVRDGEALIVMEDDLLLDPTLPAAVEALPGPLAHCGLIRLAGLTPRRWQPVLELGERWRLVRNLKGPRGTQCYALHPNGARALLAGAQVWIDAVDLYLDAFWLHGVPSYALLPSPVTHLPEAEAASSIGRVRWARKRSRREKLRRELTHAVWNLRRYWFNLRYRRPPFSAA